MDSAAVLDLMGRLEQQYAVDRWTVDGLHVWPLLRMRYYTLLVHHFLGSGARGAGQRSALGRMKNAFRSMGRIAYNQLADIRCNAWPQNDVEAVLLSDGVSLADIDGQWYDRFMDPIVAALEAQGRRSFLLMPMSNAAVPRHTPSFYVQPLLDAAKTLSTAGAKLRRRPPHDLDGLDEMVRELIDVVVGVSLPGRQWVLEQTRRIQSMSRTFEWFIGRTRARAAFVNTYYSAEGMAFVLAARRSGCVTIDVQHGNQYQHVAYGGWMKAPPQGYQFLPDLFWCWSTEETHIINERPGSLPAHRAVEVGNLWTQSWSDRTNPAEERVHRRLDSLATASGARYHFLVTPGVGFPEEDLNLLLDAIVAGQEHIHWWLRLHPNQGPERKRITSRLAAAGVRNVEIEAATAFPLPILLEAMDVNVTQASSTVIEAREAGVPSVITTAYGASVFENDIRSGFSTAATTPAEIVAAARRLADAKPLQGRPQRGRRGRLHEALSEIFDGRHATKAPAGADHACRPSGLEADSQCH